MIGARARGFTLTEMIVGIAVLFLFLAIAYVALEPVIQYLGAAQAKTDTQGNAVAVLYKLERDIHESDARGVFYDNAGAQPLPTPPTAPVDVTVFAVATADTGTNGGSCYPPGAFSLKSNGNPDWQGFKVFILSDQQLNCIFENESMSACVTDIPCQSVATLAIASAKAVAGTSQPFYGAGIVDIKIGAAGGEGVETGIVQYVNLQIQALSTVDGRTNVTSYTDKLQTRN
jgi:prepilin-type N-terminal cleavage/methylation domain-containing protein